MGVRIHHPLLPLYLTKVSYIETVSRSANTIMNYPNYEHQVMQKYQVKLIGFTFHEFISPFNINTVNEFSVMHCDVVLAAGLG